MSITIKEIAKMAGVHRSTVDKVIHNRPGVSDEVREKIQKILDENHYQANPIGKALKMQNKKIKIGVILLQVDAAIYLKKGIEKALAEFQSFNVELYFHIVSYKFIDQQEELIEQSINNGYNGLIVNGVSSDRIGRVIDKAIKQGIQVVTVNTDVYDSKRLCFVGQDGYKAGRIAGRFLGEFIGGKGTVGVLTSGGDKEITFPYGTREEGFRDLISESFPDIKILPTISTYEDSYMMEKETEYLLASNDEIKALFITCGRVKAAGEAIESIGKKNIKLVCFEEYPEIVTLIKRNVVTLTLASGLEEQGSKALQLLLDKIIYEKDPSEELVYSEIKVVVKENL